MRIERFLHDHQEIISLDVDPRRKCWSGSRCKQWRATSSSELVLAGRCAIPAFGMPYFFFRDAWCWWLPFVTLLLYTVLQFLCSVLFCDYGQFRRWIILLIWNFFKLPQCELCQHFYSFRSGSACFGTTCSSLLTWSSMLTWRWRRRAVLRLCLRVLICASTCHSTFWPFRVRHDQSLVIRQAIQEFMLPTFCQNKPFSAATLARLHRWCFEVY